MAATHAAFDQALYARWQAWAAIIGSAISFLTLVIAGLAAYFAGKAANDTRRAADAALQTVDQAKVAAEGQLRPWLMLETIHVDPRSGSCWDISLGLKNFGLSPALEVRMAVSWRFMSAPDLWIEHDDPVLPSSQNSGAVPPSGVARSPFLSVSPTQARTSWLFLLCKTTYRDGFTQNDRLTEFRVVAHVVELGSQVAMRWAVVGASIAT